MSDRTSASTRRTFLRASGLGVAGLALGGLPGSASAVDNPTPQLETDGKWIQTVEGERAKLRGFATAGLGFIDYDWYPYTIPEILEWATDGEDWHPNTIRLPVSEDPIHEEGLDYVVNDLLRPAVDLLADRGVYAVIDFHLIRPYVDAMENAEGMVEDGWNESIDDVGFDAETPTDDLLVDFWSAVAPEFADDEHVLYELFNEPTLPVSWSEYGPSGPEVTSREDSWLLWRDTAQPWVDLIREEAPETPVIVGSPHWTSETQFAPESPFDGENLIYAGHIYPANDVPEEFDDEYGAPADDVPVVITEFGWDPYLDEDVDDEDPPEDYGTTSEWGDPFREWVEGYENVGWLAWCFDDSWAPTFFESPGEGVNEDWSLKTDDEQEGWFIREWLEETRDDVWGGGDDDDGDDDDGDDDDGEDDEGIELNGYTARPAGEDGRYRDVDGSGDVGSNDVVAFFEHFEGEAVQDNADAFDFNGSGSVGFDDVVALFDQI